MKNSGVGWVQSLEFHTFKTVPPLRTVFDRIELRGGKFLPGLTGLLREEKIWEGTKHLRSSGITREPARIRTPRHRATWNADVRGAIPAVVVSGWPRALDAAGSDSERYDD